MSFVLQLLHVFTLFIITHSQNYMYHGSTYQLSHSDWEATCLFYYDTHLASIHDNSQQVEAFAATGGASSWIGAEDYSVAEDIWVWTDGTDFDYGTTYFTLPWAPDEPTGEDCAGIDENGEWNDNDCELLKYGLCAYPQPNHIIDDGASDVRSRQHPGYMGPIDILDEMYIDFYITFTSWPTAWGNILHFGNSDADRFPAIYVYGPTGTIQTSFATAATSTPSLWLKLNTEYHYTLYQTQRSVTITFGPVADPNDFYANGSVESHPIIMNQDMYLGSDWQDDFNATYRNLVVTTANSPETTFWNYICDWDDRFTERSGTWGWSGIGSGVDGDCSVRQTDTANEIRIAWMGEKDPHSLLWADYNIEVIMNLLSGSGNSMGIIFRATGQDCDTPNYCGNAYYLKMGTNGYDFAQINGAYNLLNTYSKSHSVNTPYLVRVECVGDTFKIYEANKYLVTWTDSSYAVGSVGLRTTTTDGRFSKLRITFPTSNPTTAPSQPPTSAPSTAPTQPPTSAPTPLCPNLGVTVIPSVPVPFDEADFEGFYVYQHMKSANGRPVFEVPQMSTDKNIQYVGTSPNGHWVIEGEGDGTLIYGPTDLQYPPTDIQSTGWSHNIEAGIYDLMIECVQTFAPIAAPTNAPTTPPTQTPSVSPSAAPTSPPSNFPSVAPSVSPSTAPSVAPTSPPSNVPSVAPSFAPSNAPSITPTSPPSNAPSVAPTSPPSNVPSVAPSLAPSTAPSAVPSNVPSIVPTLSPSAAPIISPTITPTSDPTSTPTTTTQQTVSPNMQSVSPTMSPSQWYDNLHFICHYKDNKGFILNFLSLRQYSKLLQQTILETIQIIGYQSVNYENAVNNPLTPWKKAAILYFVICNVFNTELILNNIDCPSYFHSDSQESEDYDEYVAIAVFGIVANNAVHRYKKEIIEIMESDEFMDKCVAIMNKKINNKTQSKRRLLEYDSFEITDIDIVDPLNYTITTTYIDEDEQFKDKKNNSKTTIIISVVVGLLFIFIVILAVIFYFYSKKENKKRAGEGMHSNEIAMVEKENDLEGVEGVYVDDDILQSVNETHKDNEIVNAVNQTVL